MYVCMGCDRTYVRYRMYGQAILYAPTENGGDIKKSDSII